MELMPNSAAGCKLSVHMVLVTLGEPEPQVNGNLSGTYAKRGGRLQIKCSHGTIFILHLLSGNAGCGEAACILEGDAPLLSFFLDLIIQSRNTFSQNFRAGHI